MQIPTQKELLSATDKEILYKIRPYANTLKKMGLRAAWNQFHMYYPRFPFSRFKRLWEKM